MVLRSARYSIIIQATLIWLSEHQIDLTPDEPIIRQTAYYPVSFAGQPSLKNRATADGRPRDHTQERLIVSISCGRREQEGRE